MSYILNHMILGKNIARSQKAVPSTSHRLLRCQVVNSPGLAGAVLQTPLLLINLLIHHVILFSESSRHCLTKAIRAEELNCVKNIHPHPCVTCHVSGITCQMSQDKLHFVCNGRPDQTRPDDQDDQDD